VLVPVLPFTVTAIVPVVASVGTVVVIVVVVLAVTTAATPLNFTMLFAGVASKLVPVMTTEDPPTPFVGVKLIIVGVGTTASFLQERSKEPVKTMSVKKNNFRCMTFCVWVEEKLKAQVKNNRSIS